MMQYLRSLVWTDYFFYSISDFREVYRRIRLDGGKSIALSFMVPFFVSAVSVISVSLAGGAVTGFFYYRITYGIILAFILEVFQVFIYSALMDGVSQLQGLRGNVKEIVAVVNYAQFPRVFILPLVSFFAIIDFGVFFFYAVGIAVFFVWYVVNLMQGLSEMHSIDMGRAFAIYILPAVAFGLIGISVLVLVSVLMGGYIGSLGI